MKNGRSLKVLFLAATLIATTASLAHAQPRAEVGASLISTEIGLGDQDLTTVSVPTGGFTSLHPGMYASFFVGTHAAIEPKLGLVWASFDGDSAHILNFLTQFDYFILETSEPSPYLFGTVGFVDLTNEDYTPKSFGFGAGYRVPVGDRLTFRFDGRYTHFTGEFEDDEGDALAFTLSIGGIFWQR